MKRFVASAVLIALVVNLAAVAAYMWSRDGQTTVVEIEGIDGRYRAIVDGTPVDFDTSNEAVRHTLELDGPEEGTIRLIPPLPLSTFPSPSGIDAVTVIDADGNELFRDNFETLDLSVWSIDSGSFEISDGVLVPQEIIEAGNVLTLRGEGWSDYTVRVTYRNNRGGVIGTHIDGSGGVGSPGVFYHFELIRDFPNFFDAISEEGRAGLYYGAFIHTDAVESSQAIFAMLLEPYPYLLAALFVGLQLAVLFAGIERFALAGPKDQASWRRWRRRVTTVCAFLVAIAGFSVTLALAQMYYDFTPHYPDEVMYAFHAKMLAAGRLTTEIYGPSDAYFISTIKPSFIDEIGEWATFYPFGHPIALAAGVVLGAIWYVPPLIGAGTILLTYVIGRRFWGPWTGLAAAVMLAISPFVWMQSGNLLSHNTGTFYILLSLLFIVKRDRALIYGALAGLFFGLGINTRPLNMLFLVLPFGALMLAYLWNERRRPVPWFKHTGAFVVMTLLLVAAMFAYNWGVTGSLETTYAGGTGGDSSELYGFREGHTVDIGIRNMQALLSTLLLVITGWPTYVGMVFVLLPFLLGTRNRWDYFVLSCALIQMLAYAGYRFSGVFEGPRYWYEAMPFLALLAGRGIVLAADLLNRASAFLLDRLESRSEGERVALTGPLLVGGLVAVLIVWGSGGWLFGWNEEQDSHNVPYRASAIDGVFGIDSRLQRLADNVELENALVLVEPCGFFRSSNCFGSVFLRNNVDFDGDVVWLYYVEGRVEETIAAFPGRDVYIASWDPDASIRPFEGTESVPISP